MSGQFATGSNGVNPPYAGQPIPGFSGMIPRPRPAAISRCPTTVSARRTTAPISLGFYRVTPHFKTTGDGTTSRGAVTVHSFTPFSDPNGLLDSTYITGGPVYNRVFDYPLPAAQVLVDTSIRNRRLLTGADFDVESIARINDGDVRAGVGLLEVSDDGLGQRRQGARSIDQHRRGGCAGGGAAGTGRKRGRNDDEALIDHGAAAYAALVTLALRPLQRRVTCPPVNPRGRVCDWHGPCFAPLSSRALRWKVRRACHSESKISNPETSRSHRCSTAS